MPRLLASGLALLVSLTAAPTPAAAQAKAVVVGRTLEWPEAPRSQVYRLGDLALEMRNIVDPTDPSILHRSLVLRNPGASPLTIEGDDGAYAPTVMVVRDPSGVPIILFQTYSGGAHCCTTVHAIDTLPEGFQSILIHSGDGGPLEEAPTDVDGDGELDFVFYDNAFLYRFASYADSFAPPTIFNIQQGEAVDVSARPGFRALFETSFAEAHARCLDPGDQARNGACAAFVASAARLGRFEQAWAEMSGAYDRTSDWGLEVCRVPMPDGECPSGERAIGSFPEVLRSFLVEQEYIAG